MQIALTKSNLRLLLELRNAYEKENPTFDASNTFIANKLVEKGVKEEIERLKAKGK